MKKTRSIHLVLLGIILTFPAKMYSQTNNSKHEIKMETNQAIEASAAKEYILIDQFIVPQNARQEFVERMNINRNFIKDLPGFVEDNVYERTDEHGNLIVVTVAVWQNEEAIRKAKEAVQAEYKRQDFNMAEMLKRLDISIDRGIYKRAEDKK
jgi:heme-degrading monooxygenase HmoA